MPEELFSAKFYRGMFRKDPDPPPCLVCSDEQLDLCSVAETAMHQIVTGTRQIGCSEYQRYLTKKWRINRKEKEDERIR